MPQHPERTGTSSATPTSNWLATRYSSSLPAAYRRSILFLFGEHMNPEDLSQLVSDLSPAEQSAVKEFITFLKERNGKSPETSFQAAIEEFIAAHPELLVGSPSDALPFPSRCTRRARTPDRSVWRGTGHPRPRCHRRVFGRPQSGYTGTSSNRLPLCWSAFLRIIPLSMETSGRG